MTPEQERVEGQAREVLVNGCLEREGLPPQTSALVESAPASPELHWDPWLGLLDGEFASRVGYKAPHDLDEIDSDGSVVPQQALPVDPECFMEAMSRLHDGIADPDGVIVDLALLWEKIEQQARGAREVIDALSRWSLCMKEEGFDYEIPSQPFEEYGSGQTVAGEGERINGRELQTASADVACKFAARVVPEYRAALLAAKESMVERERVVVEEAKTYIKQTLNNAGTILKSPPGS